MASVHFQATPVTNTVGCWAVQVNSRSKNEQPCRARAGVGSRASSFVSHELPGICHATPRSRATGMASNVLRVSASTSPGASLRDQAAANVSNSERQAPSPFVAELASQAENLPGENGVLSDMRSEALKQLRTMSLPNTRVEQYRFTDVSSLTKHKMVLGVPTHASVDISAYSLPEADASRIVVVDGVYSPSLSKVAGLPVGVFVGPMSAMPEGGAAEVHRMLGSVARSDFFSVLNAATVQSVTVIKVPAHVAVSPVVHIVYVSTAASGDAMRLVSPLTLVVAEESASLTLVEEHVGDGAYLSLPVIQFVLGEAAVVRHGSLQEESPNGMHIKNSYISQHKESDYTLTEAELGGRLARHNVNMEQLGAATRTGLASFLLAGDEQLLDLHSAVRLDHPSGYVDQLHKCIVTAPNGRGVFDGNVKVNRMAQKTDARQLSRNLLLSPRATVNVKPNLQIIADDVKCSHGATISDLNEDEIFYFQSRGIDVESARNALVFSFGSEILRGMPTAGLRKRIEASMKARLQALGAVSN